MADVSKEKKLAALRDLADKMGFSLTKKAPTKKMMRGGSVQPKRMRGGGMAKMAKKKMMRGGAVKKK